MELDDIVVGSRTQDEKTIREVLGEEYENLEVETDTDQPPEIALEPVVDPAAPPVEPEPVAVAATPEPEKPVEPAKPNAESPDVKLSRGAKARAKWRARATQYETENQALKAKLAELQKKPAAPVEPAAIVPETKPPAPVERPKLKTFVDNLQDGEAYEDGLQRWKDADDEWQDSQKRVKEPPKPEGKQDAAPPVAAPDPAWNAQLEVAKAYHPDWDEVINRQHEKPMHSPVLIKALQTLDDGAELVYQLGLHPEVSQRLAQLTTLPADATQQQIEKAFAIAYRELGKIVVPSEEADDERDAEDLAAAPPPAAPAAPAPVAAAVSAPAAAPPAAPAKPAPRAQKVDPPSTVGNRGPSRSARIEDLSTEEIRAMDNDEWRQRTSARR